MLDKFNINKTQKRKTLYTGDNINENKKPFDKAKYKSAIKSLIIKM